MSGQIFYISTAILLRQTQEIRRRDVFLFLLLFFSDNSMRFKQEIIMLMFLEKCRRLEFLLFQLLFFLDEQGRL